MTLVHIPQRNLKNIKIKIGLIQTFLNNISDSQEVSQKLWNTVSFHLLKLAAFKTSGLKMLNICFKLLECSNA